MENPLVIATRYFEKQGWKFNQVEDQPMLQFGYSGRQTNIVCLLYVKAENKTISFYSILSDKADDSKKAALAEYLTRVNFGLPFGNFEMDWSSGEVRYKTSMFYIGDTINDDFFEALIFPNLIITEKYFAGMAAILFNDKSPEEGLSIAETISAAERNS